MARQKHSYLDQANKATRDTIGEFHDQIVGQLRDHGQAGDHLMNDYDGGDEYHIENHEQRQFTPHEARRVLSDLHHYNPNDEGLWQGLHGNELRQVQASYTFGNAVMHHFRDAIHKINHDAKGGILHDMLQDADDADDGIIRERIKDLIE